MSGCAVGRYTHMWMWMSAPLDFVRHLTWGNKKFKFTQVNYVLLLFVAKWKKKSAQDVCYFSDLLFDSSIKWKKSGKAPVTITSECQPLSTLMGDLCTETPQWCELGATDPNKISLVLPNFLNQKSKFSSILQEHLQLLLPPESWSEV